MAWLHGGNDNDGGDDDDDADDGYGCDPGYDRHSLFSLSYSSSSWSGG